MHGPRCQKEAKAATTQAQRRARTAARYTCRNEHPDDNAQLCERKLIAHDGTNNRTPLSCDACGEKIKNGHETALGCRVCDRDYCKDCTRDPHSKFHKDRATKKWAWVEYKSRKKEEEAREDKEAQAHECAAAKHQALNNPNIRGNELTAAQIATVIGHKCNIPHQFWGGEEDPEASAPARVTGYTAEGTPGDPQAKWQLDFPEGHQSAHARWSTIIHRGRRGIDPDQPELPEDPRDLPPNRTTAQGTYKPQRARRHLTMPDDDRSGEEDGDSKTPGGGPHGHQEVQGSEEEDESVEEDESDTSEEEAEPYQRPETRQTTTDTQQKAQQYAHPPPPRAQPEVPTTSATNTHHHQKTHTYEQKVAEAIEREQQKRVIRAPGNTEARRQQGRQHIIIPRRKRPVTVATYNTNKTLARTPVTTILMLMRDTDVLAIQEHGVRTEKAAWVASIRRQLRKYSYEIRFTNHTAIVYDEIALQGQAEWLTNQDTPDGRSQAMRVRTGRGRSITIIAEYSVVTGGRVKEREEHRRQLRKRLDSTIMKHNNDSIILMGDLQDTLTKAETDTVNCKPMPMQKQGSLKLVTEPPYELKSAFRACNDKSTGYITRVGARGGRGIDHILVSSDLRPHIRECHVDWEAIPTCNTDHQRVWARIYIENINTTEPPKAQAKANTPMYTRLADIPMTRDPQRAIPKISPPKQAHTGKDKRPKEKQPHIRPQQQEEQHPPSQYQPMVNKKIFKLYQRKMQGHRIQEQAQQDPVESDEAETDHEEEQGNEEAHRSRETEPGEKLPLAKYDDKRYITKDLAETRKLHETLQEEGLKERQLGYLMEAEKELDHIERTLIVSEQRAEEIESAQAAPPARTKETRQRLARAMTKLKAAIDATLIAAKVVRKEEENERPEARLTPEQALEALMPRVATIAQHHRHTLACAELVRAQLTAIEKWRVKMAVAAHYGEEPDPKAYNKGINLMDRLHTRYADAQKARTRMKTALEAHDQEEAAHVAAIEAKDRARTKMQGETKKGTGEQAGDEEDQTSPTKADEHLQRASEQCEEAERALGIKSINPNAAQWEPQDLPTPTREWPPLQSVQGRTQSEKEAIQEIAAGKELGEMLEAARRQAKRIQKSATSAYILRSRNTATYRYKTLKLSQFYQAFIMPPRAQPEAATTYYGKGGEESRAHTIQERLEGTRQRQKPWLEPHKGEPCHFVKVTRTEGVGIASSAITNKEFAIADIPTWSPAAFHQLEPEQVLALLDGQEFMRQLLNKKQTINNPRFAWPFQLTERRDRIPGQEPPDPLTDIPNTDRRIPQCRAPDVEEAVRASTEKGRGKGRHDNFHVSIIGRLPARYSQIFLRILQATLAARIIPDPCREITRILIPKEGKPNDCRPISLMSDITALACGIIAKHYAQAVDPAPLPRGTATGETVGRPIHSPTIHSYRREYSTVQAIELALSSVEDSVEHGNPSASTLEDFAKYFDRISIEYSLACMKRIGCGDQLGYLCWQADALVDRKTNVVVRQGEIPMQQHIGLLQGDAFSCCVVNSTVQLLHDAWKERPFQKRTKAQTQECHKIISRIQKDTTEWEAPDGKAHLIIKDTPMGHRRPRQQGNRREPQRTYTGQYGAPWKQIWSQERRSNSASAAGCNIGYDMHCPDPHDARQPQGINTITAMGYCDDNKSMHKLRPASGDPKQTVQADWDDLTERIQITLDQTASLTMCMKAGRRADKCEVQLTAWDPNVQLPTFKSVAWDYDLGRIITANIKVVAHIAARTTLKSRGRAKKRTQNTETRKQGPRKDDDNQLALLLQAIDEGDNQDPGEVEQRTLRAYTKYLGLTSNLAGDTSPTGEAAAAAMKAITSKIMAKGWTLEASRRVLNTLLCATGSYAPLQTQWQRHQIAELARHMHKRIRSKAALAKTDPAHLVTVDKKLGGYGIRSPETVWLQSLARTLVVTLNESPAFGGAAARSRLHSAMQEEEEETQGQRPRNHIRDAIENLSAYGIYLRDTQHGIESRMMAHLTDKSSHIPPPVGPSAAEDAQCHKDGGQGNTAIIGEGLTARMTTATTSRVNRHIRQALQETSATTQQIQREEYWARMDRQTHDNTTIEPLEYAQAAQAAVNQIVNDVHLEAGYSEWRPRTTTNKENHNYMEEVTDPANYKHISPNFTEKDVTLTGDGGQRDAVNRHRDKARLRKDRTQCPLCQTKQWTCGHISDKDILDHPLWKRAPRIVATDGGHDKATEGATAKSTAAAVLLATHIPQGDIDGEGNLTGKEWQEQEGDREKVTLPPNMSTPLLIRATRLPNQWGAEETENTTAEILGCVLATTILPLDQPYVTLTDNETARTIMKRARLQRDDHHSVRRSIKVPYRGLTTALIRHHDERHTHQQRPHTEQEHITRVQEQKKIEAWMHQAQEWVARTGDRRYPTGYADTEALAAGAGVYTVGIDSHQLREDGTHRPNERHPQMTPAPCIVGQNHWPDVAATALKSTRPPSPTNESEGKQGQGEQPGPEGWNAQLHVPTTQYRFGIEYKGAMVDKELGRLIKKACQQEAQRRWNKLPTHGAIARLWKELHTEGIDRPEGGIRKRMYTGRTASSTRQAHMSAPYQEFTARRLQDIHEATRPQHREGDTREQHWNKTKEWERIAGTKAAPNPQDTTRYRERWIRRRSACMLCAGKHGKREKDPADRGEEGARNAVQSWNGTGPYGNTLHHATQCLNPEIRDSVRSYRRMLETILIDTCRTADEAGRINAVAPEPSFNIQPARIRHKEQSMRHTEALQINEIGDTIEIRIGKNTAMHHISAVTRAEYKPTTDQLTLHLKHPNEDTIRNKRPHLTRITITTGHRPGMQRKYLKIKASLAKHNQQVEKDAREKRCYCSGGTLNTPRNPEDDPRHACWSGHLTYDRMLKQARRNGIPDEQMYTKVERAMQDTNTPLEEDMKNCPHIARLGFIPITHHQWGLNNVAGDELDTREPSTDPQEDPTRMPKQEGERKARWYPREGWRATDLAHLGLLPKNILKEATRARFGQEPEHHAACRDATRTLAKTAMQGAEIVAQTITNATKAHTRIIKEYNEAHSETQGQQFITKFMTPAKLPTKGQAQQGDNMPGIGEPRKGDKGRTNRPKETGENSCEGRRCQYLNDTIGRTEGLGPQGTNATCQMCSKHEEYLRLAEDITRRMREKRETDGPLRKAAIQIMKQAHRAAITSAGARKDRYKEIIDSTPALLGHMRGGGAKTQKQDTATRHITRILAHALLEPGTGEEQDRDRGPPGPVKPLQRHDIWKSAQKRCVCHNPTPWKQHTTGATCETCKRGQWNTPSTQEGCSVCARELTQWARLTGQTCEGCRVTHILHKTQITTRVQEALEEAKALRCLPNGQQRPEWIPAKLRHQREAKRRSKEGGGRPGGSNPPPWEREPRVGKKAGTKRRGVEDNTSKAQHNGSEQPTTTANPNSIMRRQGQRDDEEQTAQRPEQDKGHRARKERRDREQGKGGTKTRNATIPGHAQLEHPGGKKTVETRKTTKGGGKKGEEERDQVEPKGNSHTQDTHAKAKKAGFTRFPYAIDEPPQPPPGTMQAKKQPKQVGDGTRQVSAYMHIVDFWEHSKITPKIIKYWRMHGIHVTSEDTAEGITQQGATCGLVAGHATAILRIAEQNGKGTVPQTWSRTTCREAAIEWKKGRQYVRDHKCTCRQAHTPPGGEGCKAHNWNEQGEVNLTATENEVALIGHYQDALPQAQADNNKEGTAQWTRRGEGSNRYRWCDAGQSLDQFNRHLMARLGKAEQTGEGSTFYSIVNEGSTHWVTVATHIMADTAAAEAEETNNTAERPHRGSENKEGPKQDEETRSSSRPQPPQTIRTTERVREEHKTARDNTTEAERPDYDVYMNQRRETLEQGLPTMASTRRGAQEGHPAEGALIPDSPHPALMRGDIKIRMHAVDLWKETTTIPRIEQFIRMTNDLATGAPSIELTKTVVGSRGDPLHQKAATCAAVSAYAAAHLNSMETDEWKNIDMTDAVTTKWYTQCNREIARTLTRRRAEHTDRMRRRQETLAHTIKALRSEQEGKQTQATELHRKARQMEKDTYPGDQRKQLQHIANLIRTIRATHQQYNDETKNLQDEAIKILKELSRTNDEHTEALQQAISKQTDMNAGIQDDTEEWKCQDEIENHTEQKEAIGRIQAPPPSPFITDPQHNKDGEIYINEGELAIIQQYADTTTGPDDRDRSAETKQARAPTEYRMISIDELPRVIGDALTQVTRERAQQEPQRAATVTRGYLHVNASDRRDTGTHYTCVAYEITCTKAHQSPATAEETEHKDGERAQGQKEHRKDQKRAHAPEKDKSDTELGGNNKRRTEGGPQQKTTHYRPAHNATNTAAPPAAGSHTLGAGKFRREAEATQQRTRETQRSHERGKVENGDQTHNTRQTTKTSLTNSEVGKRCHRCKMPDAKTTCTRCREHYHIRCHTPYSASDWPREEAITQPRWPCEQCQEGEKKKGEEGREEQTRHWQRRGGQYHKNREGKQTSHWQMRGRQHHKNRERKHRRNGKRTTDTYKQPHRPHRVNQQRPKGRPQQTDRLNREKRKRREEETKGNDRRTEHTNEEEPPKRRKQTGKGKKERPSSPPYATPPAEDIDNSHRKRKRTRGGGETTNQKRGEATTHIREEPTPKRSNHQRKGKKERHNKARKTAEQEAANALLDIYNQRE